MSYSLALRAHQTALAAWLAIPHLSERKPAYLVQAQAPAVYVIVEAANNKEACKRTSPHFTLCGDSGNYAEYDSITICEPDGTKIFSATYPASWLCGFRMLTVTKVNWPRPLFVKRQATRRAAQEDRAGPKSVMGCVWFAG